MAFFHCVFEEALGTWSCRDGRTRVDEHSSLKGALAHLTELLGEEDATRVLDRVERPAGPVEEGFAFASP